MPRKPDPLSSFYLKGNKTPMASGQGAKKGRESPEEFLKRVTSKTAPRGFVRVITALEGDVDLAALYYGLPAGFIRDICATHKHCEEARQKAHAVKIARQKDKDSLADVIKKHAEEDIAKLPDLPRRERWPVDDTERRHAIRDWLIDSDALVLYEGDLVRISEGGTIPMHVLVALMAGDEELGALRELGLRIRAERAASRMMELSETSNQPTATDKILKAFGDERWGDRSKVDVRRVGFEPPAGEDEGDELVSVLRRVK